MDKQEILDKITQLASLSQLNDLRLKLFGKEGEITKQLKTIPTLSPQERGVAGKELNLLKTEAEEALTSKEQELKNQSLRSAALRTLDVTLPGVKPQNAEGSLHPITQMRARAEEIFE
ncbi:MAG: phenylalanine--tRNA ligase subunit alpha, partial [bacterium]|nr:phenylalanine--tRNA ligase subunit alpha [bacterium]